MPDFETVYQRYFQTVYRYLLSLNRDAALAEEITQATFFAALKKIGTFREDCAVESWLIGIARNRYFDHCRRQKHRASSCALSTETVHDTPDDLYFRSEATGRFHQLLHALSEPYKEVFMLRVYGEMNFAAIAGLFQKTESWARVTYYRAKQKLQSQIREEENHG
ncbi:MAG TPA: RNA polymerase sigma factor [Candidatus Limiplasma sp.]|nr:RNA polymerase sigma factor [Candidatus Limiplasma sp.]HRX07872.1 RNA polymerase sigma factor [Candidatus Limiplasma sp.]